LLRDLLDRLTEAQRVRDVLRAVLVRELVEVLDEGVPRAVRNPEDVRV